ncbi:MAG TPA: hypothetical protein VKT33_03200, partial [Candidatus Angelobacter sp.]|nr:hypothetical protein [Candidatus Angelobacter sp.]
MRRRKKKTPENESEATGKVGQQKPPVDELHPEPIVPSYVGDMSEEEEGGSVSAVLSPSEPARIETEVQPELPSTPPPEQQPVQAVKSGRPPKG